MRSTRTLLAVAGLLSALLLVAPALGFDPSDYSQPRSGFSADTAISIDDTAIYKTSYISENGSEWTPINLSGQTTKGNWILAAASSDVDLAGIRYVAAYSCTWNDGWDCSETWQIKDRGEQAPSPNNETNTTQPEQNPSTQYLVQDGQPLADIVVAPDAPNMVVYASELFQDYIRQMTGATLPINNAPDSTYGMHVYVGASQYIDELGVTATGTRDGGYKMVSGDGYLVLLGDDEPLDTSKYMSLSEWDALTAPDVWHNSRIDDREHNGNHDIWSPDGRGSMNAVHAFLRGQGMRWYHPDTWGNVVPDKQDIIFEKMNTTVNPDFPLRDLSIYYLRFGHLREGIYGNSEFGSAEDHMRWVMSLGANDKQEYIDGTFPHGLNAVTQREETKQDHPEYYAVWDGKRMDGLDGTHMKQNLCSQGLLEETIRYAKTIYDTYDAKYVSVWPADGFDRVSEHSQECLDMATPERGRTGKISNYVWDFTNNVAWAIHDDPNYGDDRMIIGGAYTTYQLPPTELSDPRGMAPNIAVFFTRWRTWSAEEDQKQYYQELISNWTQILPSNQVFTYDYYLNNRKESTTATTPFFYPHIIDEDLKFLKDRSGGEFSEIYSNWPGWNLEYDSFAATGLNTWVTSQLYWDADQDVDALLNEYYNLNYGPAAEKMRELVEYSENNIPELDKNPEHLGTMRSMAQEALSQAPSGSDYEKRISNLLQMINHGYAGEETTISSCQDLTSVGTTYKLTQDVSADGTCFFIDQNGITLDCQGHTITYSTGGGEDDYGVYAYGRKTGRGHYSTIKNCDIQDGSYNTGSQTGDAISIGYPDYITIQDNTINTSGRGISLGRSTNSTVRGNTVHAQGRGMGLFNGNSDAATSISSHTVEDNVIQSESLGAYFYRITDDVIRNNTFIGGSDNGLRMFYPLNTILENNEIRSDTGTALYIYGDENVQQSGNTVIDG